jgi:hypothetical protein
MATAGPVKEIGIVTATRKIAARINRLFLAASGDASVIGFCLGFARATDRDAVALDGAGSESTAEKRKPRYESNCRIFILCGLIQKA